MGKFRFIINRISNTLDVISKKHYSEVNNEVISSNISRVKSLSILLIFMNLLMVLVDLTIYYPRWSYNIGYTNLFYAHIFIIVERSLYIFAGYLMNHKKTNSNYKLNEILIIYSCSIALVWCSLLSINAQSIHGQISAFIISNFGIASIILMLPMQSLIIFAANSVFFVTMLYFTAMSHGNFASNAINVLFVLSFSYCISYINIYLFLRDLLNKKTIQLQAIELVNAKDKLEEMVKIRTEELVRANEQLIEEIGIRHELEMQSVKTRLMYEENAMLLNEIKEYEELRKVFFANLSHELRTPLNVIFSAQQMMDLIINKQTCEECKTSISKYNKIVKQNCYRLLRLISNLIDITKIDAKYLEINKKNCDIVKIVENITQSVAVYIKDKHLELHFETEIKEKIIACDPDKLERIMLNLLSNAVKFTLGNGQIYVKVRLLEGHVVISVKDNGIGISKEIQPMVFERFIQADKSMARNREGSGIGLSLVKALVDLHQGKIYLTSEPGKGSEFVIELPDELLQFEDHIACACDTDDQNIERIHIEFSDIYS